MGKVIRFGMAGLVAASLLGAAPSAFASHRSGGGGIVTSGSCSAASEWKLKLSKEDANRIEVEFEVDQNVVGDTWKVVLKDNGTQFFSGKRTTQAPSGSFELRRFTADQAGTDNIVAKARNLSTDETCKGTGSI
jgi:hypothetical protein